MMWLKTYFKKSRAVQHFFKYRPLIYELIIRDLKVKYRRSVLGYVWSLLNPLLMMAVMTVIFSYMFRFVPYILAENPDISLSNALKKSKEMTDNIKIDLFVFDLSFILWYILASVINGLVFLFPFVKIPLGSCLLAPYTEQTFAFVYSDIRSKYTLY